VSAEGYGQNIAVCVCWRIRSEYCSLCLLKDTVRILQSVSAEGVASMKNKELFK